MSESNICTYLLRGKEILKRLNTYEYVYVVCGNETCDLDSAVSSLVYGYTLYRKDGPRKAILSILNISAEEFRVKCELICHLKHSNIDIRHIIFRNEIDLEKLHNQGKLKLILVDHHSLAPCDVYLRQSVIEIIDHRPQDPVWIWNDIKVNIELVGSCCTIIAKILMDVDEALITWDIGALLYGPIVLDTMCLSENAGIATNQDHRVATRLEHLCKLYRKTDFRLCNLDRKTVFRKLKILKSYISHMSPKQVLTKDLKITCGIPIIGLSISAKDFLKRESAQQAVKSFCSDVEASVAVIMGLSINDNVVKRDLAVYSERFPNYVDQLVGELRACEEPELGLQPVTVDAIKSDFALFDIGNIQASRKKVLPVIRMFAQYHPPPPFH